MKFLVAESLIWIGLDGVQNTPWNNFATPKNIN
jgi:hypothetical protein